MSTLMRTLIVSALAPLFSACSTVTLMPPAEPPSSLAWKSEIAAPHHLQQSFTNPDVWVNWADAELRSLQELALARNRDVSQAYMRLRKAELSWQAVKLDAGLKPSLSLKTSASQPLDTDSVSRSAGLSAGLSYEVDLWGRLSGATEVQAAQLEIQRTDVAAAQGLLRSQVAERSWTIAALALEAPFIEAQRKGAAEILDLTRLRVQEGKLLPVEIDKAAIVLQAVQVRQAQLSRDRLLQQLGLEILLDDSNLVFSSTLQLPIADLPDIPLGKPAEALSRRPDVQRARWGVDAALAQQRSVQGARYPQLSFNASVSTGGSAWRDWLDKPLANLAASLLVPMIDWRLIELQRNQAHNDVALAALALRDTLHRAQVEIEQVAVERQALAAEARAQSARLAEAQRTERLVQLRLELGTVSKLDLLQVRNARLAAEQEVVQMRLRRALNFANLVKALAL
jgi:outer membrane protein TolC